MVFGKYCIWHGLYTARWTIIVFLETPVRYLKTITATSINLQSANVHPIPMFKQQHILDVCFEQPAAVVFTHGRMVTVNLNNVIM